MMLSRFISLIPLACLSIHLTSAEFIGTPRCGDCWCIVDDNDGTSVCPTNTTGITDGFSSTDELYATFQLTNEPDFLKLQSESGGACYPFKSSFDDPPYLEADGDQCISTDNNDDDSMVCGYVYDSSSTTCKGRKYEIQTFASADEATMTGAQIVHQGACGVCSSAQDFGARIKSYGTLETESIKCATSFTFSQDFAKLNSCYSDLGFTEDCAALWSHFAATNGKTCAFDCFPTADGIILNGPAPECKPSTCLECQEDFRDNFDDIAGMRFNKAGITERITQSCDSFYRVMHDPCVGIIGGSGDGSGDNSGGGENVEAPSTTPEVTGPFPANESSSGNHNSGLLSMIFSLSLNGIILAVA